jgi:hypothetical protein
MNRYSPICDPFSHVISVDDVVSVVVAFESNLVQHMLAVIQTKDQVRAVMGLIRGEHDVIVATIVLYSGLSRF